MNVLAHSYFAPEPAHATTSRHARLAALGAIAAGCFTQALLWNASIGAGWLVLDVALVAAVLLLFARDAAGRLRPSDAGAVLAASNLSLGASLVYRASDWTLAIALPANIALLVLLPFVLARRIRLSDLPNLPRAIWQSARRTPEALIASAGLPQHALDPSGKRRAAGLLRGLAVGAPLATIFTLLLSADASFARALSTGARSSGHVFHFAGLSLLYATGYLFAYVFHAREQLAATHAPAPIPMPPYRSPRDEPALVEATTPKPPRPLVRPFTWGTVLVQIALVFALFGAVNARVLFAGHSLARARFSVTYAQYLHAGFAQLSIAVVLAVVAVVAGHHALRPRGSESAVPGGAWLSAIEATLLAFTGVALLSCWQRLRVYEVAYGYTQLRLGVEVLQCGVLVLLLLTLVKSLRRAWRGWATSACAVALALAVVAAWINADLYVARGNIERAAAVEAGKADPYAWKSLDVAYLESLSADASPVLDQPFLRANPQIADALREAWTERAGARREGGWRSFRGVTIPALE